MRVHSPERPPPRLTPTIVLLMIWSVVVFPAWIGGPFLAAGKLTWVSGWVYCGVLAIGLSAHRIYLKQRNPELLLQRKAIGAGGGYAEYSRRVRYRLVPGIW